MDSKIEQKDRFPLDFGHGDIFSARDLALCSTEEARALLPYESAVRLAVLPIALTNTNNTSRIHCAVAHDGVQIAQAVRFLTDREPILTPVPREVVEAALVSAYLASGERVVSDIRRLSHARDAGARLSASDLPKPTGDAAKFLTTILEFSVARGASDLHLCPSPQGAFLRIRVDGELLTRDSEHYPRALHEQLVSRLKVLAGLDIACKQLPQDGACALAIGPSTRSIRLSTLPTVDGESVVVRFLYARKLPQLSLLGLEPVAMSLVKAAILKSQGVLLLTGPTGSGKTTTMYSLALELQNRGLNVVSVEDPVEAPIPGMIQVQVHERQGLDFPRAIRSVLRHDPDVILIGEMRDGVSARMALTAAVTGHLTISSLHMGSALQALERLRAFDISARESAQAISLVLNQRLIPKLCHRCRVVDTKAQDRFKKSVTLYAPVGCPACGESGYDGRVLVSEALDLQAREVKDIYSKTSSTYEALASLPNGVFVPWTVALEHHLSRGNISFSQVQSFVDEEMCQE